MDFASSIPPVSRLFVEIWNDVAEFGLFLHRGGALLDRLERHLPKMVRKTRVQMMVAKWRRLFRRGGRRK